MGLFESKINCSRSFDAVLHGIPRENSLTVDPKGDLRADPVPQQNIPRKDHCGILPYTLVWMSGPVNFIDLFLIFFLFDSSLARLEFALKFCFLRSNVHNCLSFHFLGNFQFLIYYYARESRKKVRTFDLSKDSYKHK